MPKIKLKINYYKMVKALLISKLNWIVKVAAILVIYSVVFFALKIIFSDIKKGNKNQGDLENTFVYNKNLANKDEESHEAVYSPIIDKLIIMWRYIENNYKKYLKRKKSSIDTENINKQKDKYYNKIIYAPITGKQHKFYHNRLFMHLVLVLIITLALIVFFIIEFKFPIKLIMIIPAFIFFYYLCRLHCYLSPFTSNVKILKRRIIYVNEDNSEEVVSPIQGIVTYVKEDENSVEIKTSFGIAIFIAIKNVKEVNILVNEEDKISLGQQLFQFTKENEKVPEVTFYVGTNKPYKIKFMKKLNYGMVKQNRAVFLVACNIGEEDPILRDGDVVSITSCIYGDNEFSSKIVAANFENCGFLMADSNNMGSWEKFLVVAQNNGTVALKALENGKYVSVDLENEAKLIAKGNDIDLSEKFVFIWHEQGAYSIIASANNKIVTTDFNMKGSLVASSDCISTCEKFLIWKH
jgi:phosphotransferase system IIA component